MRARARSAYKLRGSGGSERGGTAPAHRSSTRTNDFHMNTYLIRRPGFCANLQELQDCGAKSKKIGEEQLAGRVLWIRSYVVQEPDGRFGTACIYQARDVESLREHARRVGMPGDQISPIVDTLVVREDPVATASRN